MILNKFQSLAQLHIEPQTISLGTDGLYKSKISISRLFGIILVGFSHFGG